MIDDPHYDPPSSPTPTPLVIFARRAAALQGVADSGVADFALQVARAFGVPPWVIGIGDPPARGHVSRHLRTQQLRIERRALRKARHG